MKSIYTIILSIFFLPSMAMSAVGGYDDWWLCANQCGEEDATCIDKCTDDYNNTHNTVYPEGLCISVLTDTGFLSAKNHAKNVSILKKFKFKTSSETPQCNTKPVVIAVCPRGTVNSVFDLPVYDDRGLFLKCLEPTSICIPENLEPEG